MAEGWANHLLSEHFRAYSAGIQKSGMDPLAVQVMSEAGIDISHQDSKLIEELPETEFEYVITLCDHARESCPFFPGSSRKIHQGFEDPPMLAVQSPSREEALKHYRRVRDEIKEYIASLPQELL